MQQKLSQKIELKVILDPLALQEKNSSIHINRRVSPETKIMVEKAVELTGVKTPADLLIWCSEQIVKQTKGKR